MTSFYQILPLTEVYTLSSTFGDNGRKFYEAQTANQLKSLISGAWYANDKSSFVYARSVLFHRFGEQFYNHH